ncbi:hypothetical protein M9Y10_006725 [Tritrichomonas musculus]|uniref:Uncharacterized protein n=1 Tax=Tritrichomonas musculus TaxID=1915356 RepID=A0ABR2JEX5_9EUKA
MENVFDKYLEGGYYHAQFNIAVNVERKRDSLKKQIIENYIKHIKELHMFINVGGLTNKFIFDIYITNDPLEEYTSGPQCYYIKVKTLKNTIQHFGAKFEGTNISSGNKDITLHLDRKMLRPIEEVNWDPTTNPFKYIIDQQFYSVSPNPNAATTLYTDYNITSSKIITADNITTMRSDLNLVANTQDVIVYDVDKITKRVDNLDIEMTDVKNRVTHLESKVNSVNIKTNIALVLSVASSVLSIGNTLELAGNYISIGMGKLRNFINNGYTRLPEAASEASEVEMAAVDYSENLTPVPFENSLQTYSIDETNSDGYAKLKTWIHSSHVKPKFSSLYASTNEESANNPQCMVVSYSTVHDVCMYYRDSLKPLFSVVCSKLDIMNNDLSNVAHKNDILGMVRHSDFVELEINPCTLPDDQSENLLMFTFDKPIYLGELYFTLSFTSNEHFVSDNSVVDEQTNTYNLKIIFSPYEDPLLVGSDKISDDWVKDKGGVDIINENIACLTWTTFNINEQTNVVYTVTNNSVKYKKSDRDISDLVYNETVRELDERIKQLEELKAIHDEFVTVDEVNEVLTNNYATIQYVKDAYPSYEHLNTNFKNNNQLTNILNNYALKSELTTIPGDLVNNETLTNTLNDYYTTDQVDEKFVDEDEMAYELNNYVSKTDLTTLTNNYRNKDDLSYNSNDVILTKNNNILNYEFVDVPFTFTKYSTKILCIIKWYEIFDRNEFYIDATLTKNSNVITGTYKYELTDANGVKKKYTCSEINYSLYVTTSGTISNINDMYIYEGEIEINKLGYNSKPSEFPDNKLLSAKYVSNEFNELNEKIIKLESENEILKTTIENLKPKYPWQKFYNEFTEKVDNLGIYNICKYIFFYYTHNDITVQIIYNFVKEEHSDEYLAIYTTDTGFVYYFRIDILNNKVYVNEINENETKTIDGTTAGVAATINDFEIKGLKNVERTRYRFDYVFKKSSV